MALSSVAALSTSVKTTSAQEGSKASSVKQERPDDDEINALAAKMVEANKAKMAATVASATRPGQPGHPHMVLPNQPGIVNYFSRPGGGNAPSAAASAQSTSAKPAGTGEKAPCDADSLKMRFGWVTLGKNHIPYITRFGEKYCAVRMVEMKLLSKYLTYLHSDIYNCTCVRSYYITEPEARLLNEINIKHCDSQFGREPFTTKDLVVRLQDADEFYTFLDVCYNKLMPNSNKPTTVSKCGFIRIDGESVVPYILRNGVKYVPVFYFEGEISSLFQKAELLEGWDLAYLKFCCKVQGIRAELFEKDDCSVISLEDIKGYFPAETEFHDYWPSKLVDKQLLVSTNKSEMSAASWTISPSSCAVPTPPPSKAPQPAAPTPQAVPPPRPPMPPVYSGMAMNGWNGVFHHAHNQHVSRMPRGVMHNVPLSSVAQSVHPPPQPPPQPHLHPHPQPPPLVIRAPLTVSRPNPFYHQGAMLMNMAAGASHPAQQPPPLVRVTTTPSTMSLSSPMYTTSNAIQQRMMTSQHQMLPPPQPQPQHPQPQHPQTQHPQPQHPQPQHPQPQHPQPQHPQSQHPQPQHTLPHYHSSTANANKFPPPLVSVNGTTAQPQAQPRFPYLTTNGTDIIDLSSPPHSPQMMQMAGAGAAQRAKRQLPVGNGKVDTQPKIKQIPEAVHKGPHIPYKAQKALVEGRMVPCINMKPYVYSELLMTLPDLVAHFFPALHVSEVQTTLQEVLNLDLFQGNRHQMLVLKEEGKCSSTSDFLPLVQLTDVMKYMPQMRYMFSRRGAEEPPGKMKRPS